jgi:hypothetical protein
VGDIIATIFGFFGDLGTYLGGLGTLLDWLGKLLGNLVKFLQTLWQFIVRKIIGGILSALGSLSAWLESKLQPVLTYLQNLRQILARYYNTYLRPVLMVLQRIRQFVHILALLHIGIAQRLDTFLGNLQAKILKGFYTVTGAINTLTQVLLALQDPQYLIRHPVLLISIRRQIPALITAVTGRPPGYWFPSPKGAAGGNFAPPAYTLPLPAQSTTPPASSYLSNDGLPDDLSGMVDCYEYTATAVDEVAPLDYFNNDLYPATLCPYDDPAKCLLYSWGVNV